MPVLAVPLMLISVGLLVWGFFNPATASAVCLVLGIGGALLMLLTNISYKARAPTANAEPLNLTSDEVTVFRAYPVYFLHPNIAIQYSSSFSVLQTTCLIWVAWMAWNRMWVQGGLFVVLFFLCLNLTRVFNPGHFFRFHSAKGKLTPEMQDRLSFIEEVEAKLTAFRERQ